jgi:hypothetical protein
MEKFISMAEAKRLKKKEESSEKMIERTIVYQDLYNKSMSGILQKADNALNIAIDNYIKTKWEKKEK